jgi:hypothetical protein
MSCAARGSVYITSPHSVMMVDGCRSHSVLHGSFTELLVTLNRIWRDRLSARVTQLRSQHAAEIRTLRRQLSQRIPYEQVLQKAQIVRLQRNLHQTKQHSAASGSGHKLKDDAHGSLLDLALATVENLSRQLMESETQHNALRAQIEGLGTLVAVVACLLGASAHCIHACI